MAVCGKRRNTRYSHREPSMARCDGRPDLLQFCATRGGAEKLRAGRLGLSASEGAAYLYLSPELPAHQRVDRLALGRGAREELVDLADGLLGERPVLERRGIDGNG